MSIDTSVDVDRRDAERYRKLRACFWHDSPLAVVEHPKEAVKLGYNCPSMEQLDTLVDQLPEENPNATT